MKTNRLLLTLSVAAVLLASCSKDDLTLEQAPAPQETTKPDAADFTPSTVNDSLALVALYNALDGSHWRRSNWTKTPLRYWQGVQLRTIGGQQRVTSLELFGDQLKGQLPAKIKMLTELQRLLVADSRFLTGSIIDEVFELRKLRVLNFQFTELTGQLSPRIGQLSQLDSLILWKSQFAAPNDKGQVSWERNTVLFSGSIPHEIGQLTKLRYLNLARAGFEGSLPAELGKLALVTRMDISENRLTGSIPASIGDLQQLDWLSLARNQLSGVIPEELCNASALHTFILSENQLTGSIPSQIGKLSKLSYFGVEKNQLTGSIPESLTDCVRLGLFYGGYNQLSGTIPSQLGRRHPMLIAVYLENNQLTGVLPDIVGNETPHGLWCCLFHVAGNRLSGSVPAVWMLFPGSARKTLLPQQAGFGFDNLQ